MESRSSKTLRHSNAVKEYLKFQSLQQKQETLEKISKSETQEISSLSLVHIDSQSSLTRPQSSVFRNIDWKLARDLEIRPMTEAMTTFHSKSSTSFKLSRPATSIPKSTDRSRVIIKKDFNIKRETPGPSFSVTLPLPSFIQEAKEELGRTDHTKFLPLEMYDTHDETKDPNHFINEIRSKHGEAQIYSKWFFPDGTYEWKKAKILKFDERVDRFLIQWENGSLKHASRVNIRLVEEEEQKFEERLKDAGKYRDQAEVIMKYTFYIDSMTSPTTPMPLRMVDVIINKVFTTKKIHNKDFRVFLEFQKLMPDEQHNTKRMLWKGENTHLMWEKMIYLQLGYASLEDFKENYFKNLKNFYLQHSGNVYLIDRHKVKKLMQEVEEHFKFAQHKLEFESDLPFNLEKQQLFFDILPPEKFIALKDKTIKIPEKTIIYSGFAEKVEYAQKFLPQSSAETFKILYAQNVQLLNIKNFNFFLQEFTKIHRLGKLVLVQKMEAIETMREFRNIFFDTQYSIQDILNVANEARQKRNEDKSKARIYKNQVIVFEEKVAPEIIEKLTRLLKLCNNTLERAVKNHLEYCFEFCLDQLRKIREKVWELKKFQDVIEYFQWNKRDVKTMAIRCYLVVNEGKIVVEPGLEEFLEGFNDFFYDLVHMSQRLPSLEIHDLGNTRESGFMKVFEENEDFFTPRITECQEEISNIWKLVEALVSNLTPLHYLISTSTEKYQNDLQYFSIRTVKEELSKLQMASDLMQFLFKDREKLVLGLFHIKIRALSSELNSKHKSLVAYLKDTTVSWVLKELKLIEDQELEIFSIIRHIPKNLEELSDIKVFVSNNLKDRVDSLELHISECFSCISTLEEFEIKPDEELLDRAWGLYGLATRVERVKSATLHTIRKKEKEFAEQLKTGISEILIEIENIRNKFNELKVEGDIEKYEEMYVEYGTLKDNIEKTSNMCHLFNLREGIVGVKNTDFKHVEMIKREFLNYYKIWNYMQDFSYNIPRWTKNNLSEVDSDLVSTKVESCLAELKIFQNSVFRDNPVALKLVTELNQRVNKFAPYVPLLKSLKFHGLKDRHWESISKLTGIQISKSLQISLKSLLKKGVIEFDEEIEEIAESAAREQSIEQAKIKMEKEWEHIQFKTQSFKNSDTMILVDLQEIWDKLDEHLMKVVSMCNSPYADSIEKEVNNWKNSLSKLQEILDEWEKLQKTWTYILPIFSSEDIIEELPTVASKFFHIKETWDGLMKNVSNTPVVIEFCWANPKVLEHIKYLRDTLDLVLKSLYEYLNMKRKYFPRFYFLSNEELLMILSNSREIETVQKFVYKCFEGVNRMALQDQGILGIESPEKEIVYFDEPVPLTSGGNIRSVEVWMKELENKMIQTMKSLTSSAISTFDSANLASWVESSQAQCSQVTFQVFHTNSTERVLARPSESLSSVLSETDQLLSSLVQIVRDSISESLLTKISTLIILTIHNKDSLHSLISQKPRSKEDFTWKAEMRYYSDLSQKIFIEMVDTAREYGHEYLGNQGRLVITPLTDRCQRILMTALKLFLGGAPEGPAGTGKTETTKDLAKALGKKCVVFNCSDSLDHTAMAKFFKGLCYCGAWACFDEFNRMEQEVLSVVAEQITAIQMALLEDKKVFEFEGERVNLDYNCAVFITMNPGYAGRSELPDNLKALFRPIAMMIPDYSMIAEIYLYSFGFSNARVLARKLVSSFKLASEQLSTQKHYDYGMRAVSSVIKKAGLIKRSEHVSEEEIVLKAIQESMMPKFLPEDIPLFSGILSDLFPNLASESGENEIVGFIEQALFVMKLNNKQEFVQKAAELNEILSVRHGNMLVGQALTGKSTIIEVLAKAYSFKYELNDDENKLEKVCINPKSMTLEQLMGRTDETTHDWADGVLSYFIRSYAEKQDGINWVVFDGPVDALWVENLNTVLDDNKKLCLNNGEIIKLSPSTRVLFEVEDLEQASPATVSRCGMVYLHNTTLDWKVLVHYWLKRLPLGYSNPEMAEVTFKIFEYFIDPCIQFFSTASTIVEFSPLWAVKNVISITEALMIKSSLGIKEHNQEFTEVKNSMEAERRSSIRRDTSNFKEIIQKHFMRKQTTKKMTRKRTIMSEYSMDDDSSGRSQKSELFGFFLFALAWGFGGFLEDTNKKSFNEVLYKLYSNSLGKGTGAVALDLSKKLGPIYHNESFFTHYYNSDTKAWESWSSMLIRLPKERPTDLSFLLVPCSEIVSRIYLLNKLVPKGYSALVTGPSGTGKTAIVKKMLAEMENTRYTKINNTLSAQSSSCSVKELIEGRLNKRKKNVFGGELGKRCVIVIDDLNMPVKEAFGAIPALELIRTAIDKQMWFDTLTLESQHLEDLIYLGVMASPGGGRQPLNMRLMRHLCLVTSSEYCSESLDLIFKTFLSAALEKHPGKVKDTISQVTMATIDLYQTVLSRLPPTPAKSHYTFNLRDITRVFQGISMVSPVILDNANKMYKLWVHECLRVFADRLIGSDQHLFVSLISKVMDKWIHLNYVEFVGTKELVYCNFVEDGVYQECNDLEFAREKLQNRLEEFNARKESKLEMVFFDFAIVHLARICRIISQASGHILLIGTGGSGRRSLCRMAAFLQEYEVFELQISNTYSVLEWREDLKKLLVEVGAGNTKVLFVLKDYEINNDIYFENINNILNSAEVPNLFTTEDKDAILERIREQRGMSLKTSSERWDIFIQNIKKNLHITLCMSPVGDNLKKRLRQFPSFTSCCSINWMNEWPEDALRSVTHKSLQESGISSDPEHLQSLQEICVVFHYTALQLANNYKAETRRVFNITSSHYLLLLKHIHKLLEFKQGQIIKSCEKYKLGVKKIEDTEVYVEKIKQDLINMKPVLEEKTKTTEEILKNVHSNNIQADQTRTIVSQEQKDSAIQAEIASRMKQECEEKLNKAIPELEAAIKALKTLKKDEINEVRNMQKPPHPVQLAVEAVVIINKEKPVKVSDPNDKSKISFDYFEAGKKMMKDPNFLKKLQKFDKDSIAPETIEKLKPYMENPKFEPENVRKASVAAEGLCKWVRAMFNYYFINKDVKPKQESLKIATETLEAKQNLLREKEKELREVEELIMQLKGEYESNNQEKQRLVQEIKKCELQVTRAAKLIEKLKGEKERWTLSVQRMQNDLKNLIGDIIIAAGMITYFGNFTGGFRERLMQGFWIPAVEGTRCIPCSSPFHLKQVLSDELSVQNWHMSYLPTDKASIENAIILSHSIKWPFFIDPQNQALRWISKMKQVEKTNLTIIKPGFEEFYAVVENSMFLGHSLWIENMGETLDPLLLPLLSKTYVKQPGGFAVRFGENFKQVDKKFFLYMSTTVPNPVFPPETSAKVNLLNFTITLEGLSEQLLALVCKKELPKETEDRNKLIASSINLQKKLQEFEDLILNMLQTSGENILDDEVLINSLTESKTMAEETERKLQSANVAQQRINDLQINYAQVASLSAVPFFAISDLQSIDHMYIFSMEWFIAIFVRGIGKAQANKNILVRVENLVKTVREEIFRSICMCLFDKDKILFAFLLAARLKNDWNLSLWRYFLTGISNNSENWANPDLQVFNEKVWKNLAELAGLNEFSGFMEEVQGDLDGWKKFLDSGEKFDECLGFDEFCAGLPESCVSRSSIEKLILIKCAKPEILVKGIEAFIKSELGEFYLKKQLFSINQAYVETDNLTPMVFILTSGDDPQDLIKNLSHQMNSRLFSVSLGKGQKEKASKFLKDFASSGDWLLLQNCHLMPSWMPELENILQRLRSDSEKSLIRVHPNFRLFLTTKSSSKFPITILQTSIKIINEAPTGLKNRLKTVLKDLTSKKENEEFFNKSSKPEEWQRLLFGLCFFHCQIIERQKFGSIGWNVKYDFSNGDLKVSQRQLKILVDKYLDPPYNSLIYLAGECNYGGRVTDNFDRLILNSLLENIYNDDIMYPHYRFCGVSTYSLPSCPCSLPDFISSVDTFPDDDSPEVFGLHPNASIVHSIQEGEHLIDSLIKIEAKSTSSTVNEKHEIFRISTEILNSLIPEFNIQEVKQRYPLTYSQSLNTFLTQEIEKFNTLTKVIKQSLAKLRKAIDGQIVMTHEIEALIESILKNNVPNLWTQVSYISCKKLIDWVDDLKKRLLFFDSWVKNGIPQVFWFSGFFFPQSFLTSLLQNFARKNKVSIDTLKFDVKVSNQIHDVPSDEGCLVNGLFIEGCRWDEELGRIEEAKEKVLSYVMPNVWLRPVDKIKQKSENCYECPVYRVPTRAGVLSTTGHSTNYVITLPLPSDLPHSHWVLRGVALLTQSNDFN